MHDHHILDNECRFERNGSTTDGPREQSRTVLVHVYAAKFPFAVESEEIYPPERKQEIEGCSNGQVRQSKYYVWKLLESALMRTFGLKIKDLTFTHTKNGKWECPDCCFSLSHSGALVAVALSKKSVGVDIERKDEARFDEKLAQKILTEREKKAWEQLEKQRSAALNTIWTKKEALFKCTGEGGFTPRSLETTGAVLISKELACEDERYILSVASQDAPRALFRLGDGIELVENQKQ